MNFKPLECLLTFRNMKDKVLINAGKQNETIQTLKKTGLGGKGNTCEILELSASAQMLSELNIVSFFSTTLGYWQL